MTVCSKSVCLIGRGKDLAFKSIAQKVMNESAKMDQVTEVNKGVRSGAKTFGEPFRLKLEFLTYFCRRLYPVRYRIRLGYKETILGFHFYRIEELYL